jgi:hypothetical protein
MLGAMSVSTPQDNRYFGQVRPIQSRMEFRLSLLATPNAQRTQIGRRPHKPRNVGVEWPTAVAAIGSPQLALETAQPRVYDSDEASDRDEGSGGTCGDHIDLTPILQTTLAATALDHLSNVEALVGVLA